MFQGQWKGTDFIITNKTGTIQLSKKDTIALRNSLCLFYGFPTMEEVSKFTIGDSK